uniref:eIF-4F 25 kDa subunit n=1 Tax=Megaselia scalaris TaxID=36166 RepID=T1GNT1_MEGSC
MFPVMSSSSMHPNYNNNGGYHSRKQYHQNGGPHSSNSQYSMVHYQQPPLPPPPQPHYCVNHYPHEPREIIQEDINGHLVVPEALAPDCLIKHPLQNQWTLWYLEADRSKSWEDLQNEISTFDTVEDFWSLYHYIKLASEIRPGSDYSLFKKGIRPMWEDEANKNGGRWMITLNRAAHSDIDNLWLDVILCLIGESFEHSDQICGAVINNRSKAFKISIWTADAKDEEGCLEIGTKLSDALLLDAGALNYQQHSDSMSKQGPGVKPLYTI